MDDWQLIQGCIRQDKISWNLFVERYSKLIYSTLHHVWSEKGITYKQDTIDELFNETFVALMKDDAKKLQQFQGRCSFASWIRLITTNVAIDYLRRIKPATVSVDENPEKVEKLILEQEEKGGVTEDKKIREILSNDEEKEIFSHIFEKLEVKDQVLLRLLFIDEASPEDAAQIMGLSKEAVYMRKSRLLNDLKSLIANKISVRKGSAGRQL